MSTPTPPPTFTPPQFEQGQPPKKGGRPLMWVAIGCAGLCLLGVPVMAAVLFPVFAQAKEAATRTQCVSNLKQTGMALLVYSSEFDDTFPPEADTALLKKYSSIPLTPCPKTKTDYAWNEKILGVSGTAIKSPESTAAMYDRNEAGSDQPGYVHLRRANVLMANGAVRSMRESQPINFDPAR